MDINAYLRPLLRWWRLIAIVTTLAVVSSYISTSFQPSQYISRTTLIVGKTILDPNPDSGQIFIAQQLAGIYADMARREPVQAATMQALGIPWLPAYQARVIPNTMLIEISVTDTVPQRAQIIANELANQLILQSPAISGVTETGDRQEFISEQLSSLQNQIKETEKNIEDLQKLLPELNSASQIASTENAIRVQTEKLNSLRASYSGFLANSQQGALNILSVVEPANLPYRPVSTNRYMIVILAGLVGFSLGAGAAYLLEYLDRTVKTTSDVERIFSLPVIGYISEFPEGVDQATFLDREPNSIQAENFRLLRSNIEFLQISNPIKTLLITSPSQGNGKTTIASNLALSISQSEQGVLLVDADLRRPAVHSAFNVTKEPGLSDVIKNKADVHSVVRQPKGMDLNIITAGHVPPNITEVVGSKRIASILSRLKDNFEFVIVDAPPLIISDAFNLASKVDGVILILVPGETRVEQGRAIKEQLDRSGARLLGVVFNKIDPQTISSYGDYQYQSLYSPRYYGDYISGNGDESKHPDSGSKKLLAFFERGEVPREVAMEVEHAITAIKTQPRDLVNKIRKSRAKKKASRNSAE